MTEKQVVNGMSLPRVVARTSGHDASPIHKHWLVEHHDSRCGHCQINSIHSTAAHRKALKGKHA